MKKLLVNLLALVFCGSLMACNPDKTAYESLENFTERLEQKSADWSEADWDDALQKYSEIVQTLERYNYSDEQLESIGRLEGKCMAIFVRHGFENRFREGFFRSPRSIRCPGRFSRSIGRQYGVNRRVALPHRQINHSTLSHTSSTHLQKCGCVCHKFGHVKKKQYLCPLLVINLNL